MVFSVFGECVKRIMTTLLLNCEQFLMEYLTSMTFEAQTYDVIGVKKSAPAGF